MRVGAAWAPVGVLRAGQADAAPREGDTALPASRAPLPRRGIGNHRQAKRASLYHFCEKAPQGLVGICPATSRPNTILTRLKGSGKGLPQILSWIVGAWDAHKFAAVQDNYSMTHFKIYGIDVVANPDPRFAAVQEWYKTLPEGLAEMKVGPHDIYPSGMTQIAIRPLRNPDAPTIEIGFRGEGDWLVYFSARGAEQQEGFSIATDFWPDMPLVEMCQAVVSGGLIREVLLWRGSEVGARYLLYGVEGESKPVYDSARNNFRYSRWRGLARLTIGSLFGGKENRSIHYPPYSPSLLGVSQAAQK